MSHASSNVEENIPLPNKKYRIATTGHTYAYIYHVADESRGGKRESMATLLFLHGFPSGSADWRYQIEYFKSLGHGILAPDLLGYGQTSKPLTIRSYTGRSMASDIISIIKYENITGSIIGIGHDFGTYLLSSLAVFHREYFTGFVYFSVPFGRPGGKSNVKHVNNKAAREGREVQFGYQEWFWKEETGGLIGKNWESFLHLIYPDDPSIWKTHFAPINALKTYLITSHPSSTSQHLASWISPSAKAHHHTSFGSDYSAPLMWYKRGESNFGCQEERELLEEGEKNGDLRGDLREVDVLMIGGTKDPVCGHEGAKRVMRGVTDEDRLTCVDLQAGHWAMLESPGHTNEVIRGWLEGLHGRRRRESQL